MGLPWIKVYADLPEHPKSLDLADAVGEPLAWAHMVKLWTWCSRYACDGRIQRSRAELAAGWTGKRGVFVAAAVEVGFLEEDGPDHVVAHDWTETQKGHIDKLERDRLAAAARRSVARLSCDGRATVANSSRDNRDPEERERRVEEKKMFAGAADAAPPAAPVVADPSGASGDAADAPPGADAVRPDEPPDPRTHIPVAESPGNSGFWEIPWLEGGASIQAARKPQPLAMLVEWMLYRRQQRADDTPDVAWGQVLKLLKRHVKHHGVEAMRKAWLAWLMDPWAAGLSPPYQLGRFLAVDQAAKQVARAKGFDGWERAGADDWDLPWLIDEPKLEEVRR